jgi:hypothetical protein
MAEIHRLDKQRQADRRTALLALHASGKQPSADCLDDNELACLVDGACTAEEKEKYFHHLADCSSCLHAWLELAECAQAEIEPREKEVPPA